MENKEIKPVYKIEKNIPIPIKSRYPFNEMEIGDSFEIEVGEKTTQSVILIVHSEARRFREKHPLLKFRISIRTIDKKHIRCWRVENRKEPIDLSKK